MDTKKERKQKISAPIGEAQPRKQFTREEVNAVVFNPQTHYNWDVNTYFVLTGKEFEVLFNGLLESVNTPFSVKSSMKLLSLYKLMEDKFKVGMLEGAIKVAEEPTADIPEQIEHIEFEEVK